MIVQRTSFERRVQNRNGIFRKFPSVIRLFIRLMSAFIIFFILRKIRCWRNKIHWNLITSLIMQTLTWFVLNRFVTHEMYKGNFPVCRVLVFCNFYFELAMYHWLLVEGIYLHMKVGLVYNSDRIRLWIG